MKPLLFIIFEKGNLLKNNVIQTRRKINDSLLVIFIERLTIYFDLLKRSVHNGNSKFVICYPLSEYF